MDDMASANVHALWHALYEQQDLRKLSGFVAKCPIHKQTTPMGANRQ
jgi:hypothetical protein